MEHTTASASTVDIFHAAAHSVSELAPAWPSERSPWQWGADQIGKACDADRAALTGSMDRTVSLRHLLRYTPALGSSDSPESGVGAALRFLRVSAGITVDEAARESGVSSSHLSRVEAGSATATAPWIGLVTTALARCLRGVK
jgi:hypothetical protein